MSSSASPSELPKPPYVASFETYLAAIDVQFMGADFSENLLGETHMNAAIILGKDISVLGHDDREAAQVVRDICNYTAKRIEQGRALAISAPFRTQHGAMHSTHSLAAEDLGEPQASTWLDLRQSVAQRLVDDLEGYWEEHADNPRSQDIRSNISDWLSFARQIADEFGREIIVTEGPRLLPGVRFIAEEPEHQTDPRAQD